jgi:Holliday junction DNA helicase RuvB
MNIIATRQWARISQIDSMTIERRATRPAHKSQEGDVVHRRNPSAAKKKTIEEYLYPAMEDFKLGHHRPRPNARGSVRLNLPQLTCLLTAPLLTRFPIRERVNQYRAKQLKKFVTFRKSTFHRPVAMQWKLRAEVEAQSRIANNLLRQLRLRVSPRRDGFSHHRAFHRRSALVIQTPNGLDEMDKHFSDHREIWWWTSWTPVSAGPLPSAKN